MSTISIPQVFKDCGQTLLHAIFQFSILTFTKCDRTEALETSRGNTVKSIHDYFCFHCQAWRFDLADSTAFMDVGCTLLFSEIPPSLVIGGRAICVNILDVVISVGSFVCVFFRVFFFFFSILTKSLISASASPVCRSWHFQVFRQWQECLCRQMLKSIWVLSHCLVCCIPEKKERKERTSLLQPPWTCFNPDCCLLCYWNLHGCKWRLWRFSANYTETCFYASHFLSGLAWSNVPS